MLDSNARFVGIDSVDTWLQNTGGLWTRYARTGLYNYRGEVGIADSIFRATGLLLNSAISNSSPLDTLAHASYRRLWTVVKTAAAASRSMYQLNNSEIAALDTTHTDIFTYNSGEKSIFNLSNMYTGAGSVSFPPCALVVVSGSKPGRTGSDTGASPIGTLFTVPGSTDFKVYPNPTSGIVTFAYKVPDGDGPVQISITNVLGKTVKELMLTSKSSSILWDTKGMTAGVYLYQASSRKGIVKQGKLVVNP
jgi:hypothetical protein